MLRCMLGYHRRVGWQNREPLRVRQHQRRPSRAQSSAVASLARVTFFLPIPQINLTHLLINISISVPSVCRHILWY